VLPLTQEFLAAMLAVRRSEVSETDNELKRSGLIRYRRGEITIIDHAALKKFACESYALDKQRVGTWSRPLRDDRQTIGRPTQFVPSSTKSVAKSSRPWEAMRSQALA
jgi:Crp-like helix-turn-helix domain